MLQLEIVYYEFLLCCVEDDRHQGHVHGLELQERSKSLSMPLQQGLCPKGKAARWPLIAEICDEAILPCDKQASCSTAVAAGMGHEAQCATAKVSKNGLLHVSSIHTAWPSDMSQAATAVSGVTHGTAQLHLSWNHGV